LQCLPFFSSFICASSLRPLSPASRNTLVSLSPLAHLTRAQHTNTCHAIPVLKHFASPPALNSSRHGRLRLFAYVFARVSLARTALLRALKKQTKLTGGEGIRPINGLRQAITSRLINLTVACSDPALCCCRASFAHICTPIRSAIWCIYSRNSPRTFSCPLPSPASALPRQYRKAGAAIDLFGPRPRPRRYLVQLSLRAQVCSIK
jgi:hypothetical protein